jgi:hypothetical protein
MSTLTDEQRAARDALKEERAQDALRARQEYEAEQQAIRARTERLKAMRLAKEAQDAAALQAARAAKIAASARKKPGAKQIAK